MSADPAQSVFVTDSVQVSDCVHCSHLARIEQTPVVPHQADKQCRYPEGDLDTNLTIVITNVGADFTRLGSFGDAEQFGGTLVAQMDRSYLNRTWNKPKTPVQARQPS